MTVGVPATSPYSTLFAIIKPDPFIFLYFLVVRNNESFRYENNKHFVINIASYGVFKLLQDGHLFLYFLYSRVLLSIQ